MGIVRMGAPEEEIIFLKQLFHLTRFVETGTFKGGTSIWASQFFKQVDTIEFSKPIYLETSQKFKHIPNINFINQDSRVALSEIVRTACDPILFWLDAHWCSMGSYGENDQCPLIEELNIISSSPISHFILIDDARLFMAPPPLPNLIKFYPNINQITETSNKYSLTIYEDVIFMLPVNTQEAFGIYLQKKITQAWLEYGKEIERLAALEKRGKFSKTRSLLGNILEIYKSK
jgi:hypothetical protein